MLRFLVIPPTLGMYPQIQDPGTQAAVSGSLVLFLSFLNQLEDFKLRWLPNLVLTKSMSFLVLGGWRRELAMLLAERRRVGPLDPSFVYPAVRLSPTALST